LDWVGSDAARVLLNPPPTIICPDPFADFVEDAVVDSFEVEVEEGTEVEVVED